MNYPPIHLSRKVDIQSLDVSTIISRPDSREDLLIVLRFGEEMQKMGSEFTPKTVTTKLLPNFPINAGQRILRRLEDLELVERVSDSSKKRSFPNENTWYKLTQKGEDSIRKDRIFMPERHEMEIRYIEDVLFPQSIIGIHIIEESLRTVIMEDDNTRSNKKHEKGIILVPETLRKIQGSKITILEGEDPYMGLIIFEHFDEKAILRSIEQQAVFDLVLETENTLDLKLRVGGNIHIISAPKIEYMKAFLAFLQQENISWNNEIGAVECKYADLKNEEKQSFKRNFLINEPQLNGLGVFDQTEISGITITPKTRGDAELWGDFLVKVAIRDYMTENRYELIIDEVREKFSSWENLHIQSLEELIQEEKETINSVGLYASRFWFLQAPNDLRI